VPYSKYRALGDILKPKRLLLIVIFNQPGRAQTASPKLAFNSVNCAIGLAPTAGALAQNHLM
jgi:hypothetical protein